MGQIENVLKFFFLDPKPYTIVLVSTMKPGPFIPRRGQSCKGESHGPFLERSAGGITVLGLRI